MDYLRPGSHDNDDPFGLRVAIVFIKFIIPTGEFSKIVHRFLNDLRDIGIIRINRLPGLKVHIGVLCSTTNKRVIGV